MVSQLISVIIPNRNGSANIGKCLEAVFSSKFENFEVIVVDDCSEDTSVEIIRKFPCRLICLEKHEGASKARNIGALNSNGDTLFFIDADCLLGEDTLSLVNRTLSATNPDVIAGGTYTRMPYDKGFFSIFQSVYINYSETKNAENPDYIATHAMIMNSRTFRKSGGFPENFLPILEDVELSHRLRKKGYRLIINPEIQVQHIFNFNLSRSFRNAMRKSKYWIMYSLKNRDVLADSGTASLELKINVISYFFSLFLLLLWIVLQKTLLLAPLPLIFLFNIFISRQFLKALYETGGILFSAPAFLYYTLLYPLPVGIGVVSGVTSFFLKRGNLS